MLCLVFADEGWDDLCYWIGHDNKIAKRLLRLIDECRKAPFEGIGKPEPLRENSLGIGLGVLQKNIDLFIKCQVSSCGLPKPGTIINASRIIVVRQALQRVVIKWKTK